MKKVIFALFVIVGVALCSPIFASSQDNNTVVTATAVVNCEVDSLDIPVFLVDGVEVSGSQLDSIPREDIETMTVIKNPEITKLFAPRRGGVLVMTTKSKKFLKPIIENWESAKQRLRETKHEGLIIRRAHDSSDSVPTSYDWPITEFPALFPGGDVAMIQFIADNMKYPEQALENGIEGRVIVSFIVESDGSVSNPQIMRSKHPELNEEALRIVSLFPKFEPGYRFNDDGKEAVRCWYNVPIQFKLPVEKK